MGGFFFRILLKRLFRIFPLNGSVHNKIFWYDLVGITLILVAFIEAFIEAFAQVSPLSFLTVRIKDNFITTVRRDDQKYLMNTSKLLW